MDKKLSERLKHELSLIDGESLPFSLKSGCIVVMTTEGARQALCRLAKAPLVSVTSTDHERAPESGYYFVITKKSVRGHSFSATSEGFFVRAKGDDKEIPLEVWDAEATMEWHGDHDFMP